MNVSVAPNTIVTSGFRFIDIDAFACVYAYQELLRLQGQPVQAVITATLIVREYQKAGLLSKISPMAAELLAVVILSNTLNFKAKITVDEDRQTYRAMRTLFETADDFESEYFSEVQRAIEADFLVALRDDSKRFIIEGKTFFIGQLEVWDSADIMENRLDEIMQFLRDTTEETSFLNFIELGRGRNTLIFRDVVSLETMQGYFPEFEYDLERNIAITLHVILRKEILPRLHTPVAN